MNTQSTKAIETRNRLTGTKAIMQVETGKPSSYVGQELAKELKSTPCHSCDIWQLETVGELEYEQDTSGIYFYINPIMNGGNRTSAGMVRVDAMRIDTNNPLHSWQGKANDVRKAIARRYPTLSKEHTSYLGYELARAELLGADYVQG